eukprot:6178868-Pleurochrysis_carterae.AAC.1
MQRRKLVAVVVVVDGRVSFLRLLVSVERHAHAPVGADDGGELSRNLRTHFCARGRHRLTLLRTPQMGMERLGRWEGSR